MEIIDERNLKLKKRKSHLENYESIVDVVDLDSDIILTEKKARQKNIKKI